MRRAALAVLLVACAPACWAFEGKRVYDVWAVSQPRPREVGCFRIEPWVSQSARDGVGLSVRVEGRDEAPCEVEIRGARLLIGETRVEAPLLPAPMRLTRRNAVTFRVPFVFDDRAAWDRGEREGVLLVESRAGGQALAPQRWPLARVPWEAR